MLDKRKQIYSQYGEEGILEYLINKLNLENLQVCEFGMTRKLNSNTYYIIENYDSFGVYIDNDNERLETLQRENTQLICKNIQTYGEDSLDNVLKQTPLKEDFDILSIDIDNKDYHVWDSLSFYEPKIVIIEINPFLSVTEEYIYDGTNFSSSFKSTVNLGHKKGYKLVCMTGNLIFVKKYLLEKSKLSHLLSVDDHTLFLDDAIVSPKNKRAFTFERYITKSIL